MQIQIPCFSWGSKSDWAAVGLPLLRVVLPAGAEVRLPPARARGASLPCESLSDQPGPLASEFETLDLK